MNKASSKFRGRVFRIHSKRKLPLDIKGSIKYGGRWNRENIYGALYTSVDKETSKAEFIKAVEARGYDVKDLFLRRISTIEVILKKVLDLTIPENRKKFRIKLSDIKSDEENSKEKCLKVADKARELGYEAIFSPSAADPKGKNLNIFSDKLVKGSYIKKVRTEQLIKI